MFTRIGGWDFGFTHDLVVGKSTGEKYLERWYLSFLGCTLRVHKFFRGDDDRALHDHPWKFITFPLRGYWERIPGATAYVAPFCFHYRPAEYKHMVVGTHFSGRAAKPFFTLVFTWRKSRTWGFWPGGKFVNWREF